MGEFEDLYVKDKKEAKSHALSLVLFFGLMQIYYHVGMGVYFYLEQCFDPQDYNATLLEKSVIKLCKASGIYDDSGALQNFSLSNSNISDELYESCKILHNNIQEWEEYKRCVLTKKVYVTWSMLALNVMFTTGLRIHIIPCVQSKMFIKIV